MHHATRHTPHATRHTPHATRHTPALALALALAFGVSFACPEANKPYSVSGRSRSASVSRRRTSLAPSSCRKTTAGRGTRL